MRITPLFVSLLLLIFLPFFSLYANQSIELVSPNGATRVSVELADKVYYAVQHRARQILHPSALTMTLDNGQILGMNPRLRKHKILTSDQEVKPLYGKRAVIRDQYNELILNFKDDYAITFRAYDEGIAYRFITNFKDSVKVLDELAEYNFTADFWIYASHPRGNSYVHSYEDFYLHRAISTFSADTVAMLPALVNAGGLYVGITESNLKDYPGMYLQRNATDSLRLHGDFPKFVLADAPGGHMNFHKEVSQRADYLAESAGQRTYPWRVLILAEQAHDLLDVDLVYLLADEAAEGSDFSWVQPGKVAWDWWNAWNLKGVDFKSGINTETYKYYIDFAAKYGIEYINLDEGWSDQFNLLSLSPEVDVKEIIRYADSKRVKVWLWCVARTLDMQMDTAMKAMAEWGAVGLKVDFMDRDDQGMVDFYWRTAKMAAENKLMLNFHGAYKPTGLSRTYPNVINYEGVRGLEYNKFAEPDGTTPKHAVSIPFIRMLAGQMDYTPGAMTNVRQSEFNVINDRPMSQGTRCHQLAMYVVYEAPLQMLADAPTAYEAEPEMMEFLGPVPTTWDDTRALNGAVGEFAVVARRKGDTWYVGGLTGNTARRVLVDFGFLGEGVYNADIFIDGRNAHRLGEDYKRSTLQLSPITKTVFDMAPAGGFVVKLTPAK